MNDQILLMVVVFGLLVWFGCGAAEWAWNWWRAHKTRGEILDGTVSVDYQLVVDEANRVNKVYAEGSLAEQMDEDFSVRESALTRIRENVARIREAGFVIATQATTTDRGLASNPFKRGTGESKQWVRGFCMGRNILDPKPYMDKA